MVACNRSELSVGLCHVQQESFASVFWMEHCFLAACSLVNCSVRS